ncbi:MAG: hypothetical protein ACJ8OJ_09050 [Povalibacter sp.]
MSSQVNPYAPPTSLVEDVVTADSEAESIRQEHIKHETSVRSIGLLYYFGGGIMAMGAIGFFVAGLVTKMPPFATGIIVIYGALGVLSIVLARGIRALAPWARTTSIVFACIGLLGFPLGTLLNGYILYLLLSEKGKRVFALDYPEIVAATPHIKYKTSIVVWIALAILILAIVGILVATTMKS